MTLKTWVIADHKIGTKKQCLAIAEGLGLKPTIKEITPLFPWSYLPPQFWWNALARLDTKHGDALTEPWPQVIIGGGRVAAAPIAHIKKILGNRVLTIFVQNPYINLGDFDFVILPKHDNLSAPNVIQTDGALHNITDLDLTKAVRAWEPIIPAECHRPLVAVLLGGNSHHHSMTPELMEYYASKLRQLAQRQPMSFLITASRRTPHEALLAFKTALGDTPYFLWNGMGDNPYLGFLGLADYILVTNDSISMVSEAVITRKPVYIMELDGGSARINTFFESFEEQGFIRPFDGILEEWTYTPPNDMAKVVKVIAPALKKIKKAPEKTKAK